MYTVLNLLFNYWCGPYDPKRCNLQYNSVNAYGQYAFEEGFKLAMQLTVASLAEYMTEGE